MLRVRAEGTDVMVFRKDVGDKTYYNVSLSRKDKEGKWENGSIQIKFKKDINLPDKTKIAFAPENCWLDHYKKDGKTIPYLFCMDFEVVG